MAEPLSPPSSMERSLDSSSAPKKRKASTLHLHPPVPPPPLQIHRVRAKKQRIISTSEAEIQTTNGFQHLHKCTVSIRNKHRKKRKFKVRDDQNHREWISSARDCSMFKDKVIIVSYNILGVENASNHLDLYQKVSPRFMKWSWRKKLIREELNRYKPSILCLQEVDRFSDLAELLQEDGFKGVHTARTGEAHDGCAIFWKEERHSKELIPVRVLETLPMNILRETGGLPNEKWGSDHLALVCELAFKDSGSETRILKEA